MRKDSGLWGQSSQRLWINVHTTRGKDLGTAAPVCMGPQNGQGPVRWDVAARALAPAPDHACLGQLHWLTVKPSKGCAKQAGGLGWPSPPETEMGEQKEAAWAGLAGAHGGMEGGKGEAAEGGLQGARRGWHCTARGRSQVWPLHNEEAGPRQEAASWEQPPGAG